MTVVDHAGLPRRGGGASGVAREQSCVWGVGVEDCSGGGGGADAAGDHAHPP